MGFINEVDNWQDVLVANPYNLRIKCKGPYVLMTYTPESDFGLQIVREAKGAIVRQHMWHDDDDEKSEWRYVCRGFDKFFNYGEKWSDVGQLDWSSAVVQEKIDGSLIRLWWDDEWHISTNTCIDAFEDNEFGIWFSNALAAKGITMEAFCRKLDPRWTWLFELTCPENRVVVNYGVEPRIWFLSRRNINTFEEVADVPNELLPYVSVPKTYEFHSLAECVRVAKQLDETHEGFVVRDKDFRRVKIKGETWLRLSKLKGNAPLTIERVVKLWQDDNMDDYVGNFPEDSGFINEVMGILHNIAEVAEVAFSTTKSQVGTDDRRLFASYAQWYQPLIKSYLFAKLDKDIQPMEFFKNLPSRKIAAAINSWKERIESYD